MSQSQPTFPRRPFTTAVEYVSGTLRTSIFALTSTLVAPLLMTRLDQGKELLNMITDEQLFRPGMGAFTMLQYALFFGALLLWSLANWYSSRVLLQREFGFWRGFSGGAQPFVDFWLTWFPRGLGAVGMLWIVGYFFVRHQSITGVIGLLLTAAFVAIVVTRRRWWRVKMALPPLDDQTELRVGDRVGVWLSLAFSFVLLLGLAMSNYGLARLLGAPVILFLGLGSIVMFGSIVLTYLPLAYGWPSLVWIPIALSLLFAQLGWNRNHDITQRVTKGCSPCSASRPDAKEHFFAWKTQHDGPNGERADRPIYLVAAEGGASRSAWWTSHVLSVLDYASEGRFAGDVYALSGVSGGSLGVTAYVGLVAERQARRKNANSASTADSSSAPPATAVQTPEPILRFPTDEDCHDMRANGERYALPMKSECFVGRDFLSTTLGYLVFPDLLQRFVPFPVYSWDRSLGLEKTWEKDWFHLFGGIESGLAPAAGRSAPRINLFARPIDELYPIPEKSTTVRLDLPILFLNTTRAKAGRAVLQSPLGITTSPELDDLFEGHLRTRGLPLSGVVHNSARFPLVSPGGDVNTWEGTHWDAVVDGGYFENSGAATLAEFVRSLSVCPPEKPTPCADEALLKRIRVLIIQNDPELTEADTRPVSGKPDPGYNAQELIRQEEALTPLIGLFNVRSARAASSIRALENLLPFGIDQLINVRLKDMKAPEDPNDTDRPSMSWYLNPRSREMMWSAVAADANRRSLCDVLGSLKEAPEACSKLDRFDPPPARVEP